MSTRVDEWALDTKPPRAPRKVGAAWIVGIGAWLALSAVAFGAIAERSSRPGIAGRAPASWPAASHLERTPGRATLVMVAHTKCSCTRASLSELERVMARAGARAEAFVVFVGPREAGVLDPRATARAIPGVRVVEDDGEARAFAAATSGQVMLYDSAGALVFRGGLTASRGHEGESVGGETVRRFFVGDAAPTGAPAATPSTPTPPSTPTTFVSDVFGCALFGRNDDDRARARSVEKAP